MADPVFDHLEETIRGTATPAEMRGWGRDNLVLDRVAGWNSDNLKIGAWATELRAAMLEGNGARCELLRALVHARMEHEAAGRWGGIECCGRVYPVWNLAGRLVLYRFGLALGWGETAEMLRQWLRAAGAALALASGDGPGRRILDHRIGEAEAERGAAIRGDGELVTWWDPFVAWAGDRGGQRVGKPGPEFGRWQYLEECGPSELLVHLLGLETETRRLAWMEFGRWLRALDEAAPAPDAPMGCTAAEVEVLRRARANEPAALLEAASYLWRPAVPFRILRTSAGVAMVCEQARGSSTACLDACAWWQGGRTAFLSGDPGWREPGGTGRVRPGRAVLEGWTVRAEREGREPVALELPAGETFLDVRFGPEGVTVLLPVAPVGPVVPVPDPPPAGPGGPGASPKPRRRRGLCGWLRRVFGG